jgi:hypothetical protein
VAAVFSLTYRGGVAKPGMHEQEKFLLFFLVGENEMPFYQMLKEGLATRKEDGRDLFVTVYNTAKIFTSHQGFGIQKKYHSFYVELDEVSPILTIYPFSGQGSTGGFLFKAQARLLDRKEVLQRLGASSESRKFFEKQETLALNLRERMVMIDRSEMKKGVRYVSIKGEGR